MKRILAAVCFAAALLAAGICAHASEYRSEVKVGIKYGSAAGIETAAASHGGMNIYNAETGAWLYTAAAGESVMIRMGSTGFASTNKFYAEGVAKISVQPQNGATIWSDGKEYRGYIFIEKKSDGTMTVMNILGTDDYTASVLGKEMSYNWPLEALKAQAVCARNFVLCRGNAHKDYGFDVCTTTHCQVYGGVASEHENTRRAVNETKGILATYEGKVVPLYFFATSGGKTEDVENVWGSSLGYLRSVDDPYENPEKASKYTWSVRMTRSEIEQKLSKAGISVGTLSKITVDGVSAAGRVTKLTFHGSAGSKSVQREKCRTVLGFYSQKFTVRAEMSNGIVTTAGYASTPLFALTGSGTQALAGYSAVNSGGGAYVSGRVGDADTYIFDGGGYGHGIGMSQWGARGMAESGFTYDAILKHYYTGIVLG